MSLRTKLFGRAASAVAPNPLQGGLTEPLLSKNDEHVNIDHGRGEEREEEVGNDPFSSVVVVAGAVLLGAAGIAASAAAMVTGPGLIVVYVAGGLCVVNSCTIIKNQYQLSKGKGYRQGIKALQKEANRLGEEVDLLTQAVNDLQAEADLMEGLEQQLSDIATKQGFDVHEIVMLVRENEDILTKQKANLKQTLISDITKAFFSSEFLTGDMKIDTKNLPDLLLRLQLQLNSHGMSLDTDKFTEMVQQNNRRTKQVHRSKRLHKSTRLQALHKLSILGTGSFGNKVWLVRNKTTKQPFALKIINKKQSIVHCQVEGVKREKKIMTSISHPFIVNLISTFQDSHNLYMLLQFIQGGELHSVIHQEHKDGIPNDYACFYAACILESLGYIHQHHITHRGIKPENILIDYMGYCILIDFGLAKVVHDKTYTLCGTVEYLAPEMILLKGHNKGVDYWAFGVLIYEMLVGHSPFYSEQSDQASQFTSIVNIQYSFPPGGIVNEHAQDLIRRIFVRHPHNRFGCLQRGYLDIREHPWFDGVDTVKLLEKRIVPPWIPEINDGVDASHFCYYGDLEEEVSNKPLCKHQQELFEGF